MKCLDFEDKYLGWGKNFFPLMIISGPKEPTCFAPYAKVIADEFKIFGPGTDGMQCQTISPARRTFQHGVLLGGMYGDTPARTKVGNFVGHSADLACVWCVMNSIPCVGYKIKYWKGYSDAVPVTV